MAIAFELVGGITDHQWANAGANSELAASISGEAVRECDYIVMLKKHLCMLSSKAEDVRATDYILSYG